MREIRSVGLRFMSLKSSTDCQRRGTVMRGPGQVHCVSAFTARDGEYGGAKNGGDKVYWTAVNEAEIQYRLTSPRNGDKGTWPC